MRRRSAALVLAWALRARGMLPCRESEECVGTCGRLCVDEWPVGDDALARAANEAEQYVACQEEHWGQVICEGTNGGGIWACKAADECHLLATPLAREYYDCLAQCASEWEHDNYDELESFCYGACARSCGAGSFDMGDASRFQTWEECQMLCSLYEGCPALDERYVYDPLGDEVTISPNPNAPSRDEALPEDRWNYRDTEERNELMARVREESTIEFTRLQDLLMVAAVEDESLWDEYDEYDEYGEYGVEYDAYGEDGPDEYDGGYGGYGEYGEL